jgi:hypothetical protein
MKVDRLPLEAILLRGRCVALSGPLQPLLDWHVEQQGHIRDNTVGRQCVEGVDERQVKAAAATLVGDRSIDEAVAKNQRTAGQGRPDDLVDMLGAGGGIEQQLRPRLKGSAVWVEKDTADGVGNRTPTRFPGDQNLKPALAQSLSQQADLGGLDAALDSLECIEKGHLHQSGQLNRCIIGTTLPIIKGKPGLPRL